MEVFFLKNPFFEIRRREIHYSGNGLIASTWGAFRWANVDVLVAASRNTYLRREQLSPPPLFEWPLVFAGEMAVPASSVLFKLATARKDTSV